MSINAYGDMRAGRRQNVGSPCHHVAMADELGVDDDPLDWRKPLTITAPLPAHVLRNAERYRQTADRRNWNGRKARGEIGEHEKPPPGPTAEEELILAAIRGVVAGIVFGFIIQTLAQLFGHLFSFQPGLVGAWLGAVAGMAACFGPLFWGEHAQKRDAQLVTASQLKFEQSPDRRQLTEAHDAAMTVLELWPGLPLPERPAQRDLHRALWQLATLLPPRREAATRLAALQRGTRGLPDRHSVADEATACLREVQTLHEGRDEAVHSQIKAFQTLAAECERFQREQQAIKRTQLAVSDANATLGKPATATIERPEDASITSRRVSAVLWAYQALTTEL